MSSRACSAAARPCVTTAVFFLGVICASCDQPFDALQTRVAASSVAAQGRVADQIILEFDMPLEYWSKDPSGEFLVTGFVVGYFQPSGGRPLHTIDVAREAVSLYERTGRLVLPHPRLPVDVVEFVLRLQTVSKSGTSEWSAPSPSVAVRLASAQPARNSRSVAAAPTKGTRRQVSLSELEKHPRVLAALRNAVPADAPLEKALTPFRTVEEVATALVLCTQHDVSFQQFSQTMQGPPLRPLGAAIREHRKIMTGKNLLTKARAEARQMLEPAARRPPRLQKP